MRFITPPSCLPFLLISLTLHQSVRVIFHTTGSQNTVDTDNMERLLETVIIDTISNCQRLCKCFGINDSLPVIHNIYIYILKTGCNKIVTMLA